MTQIIDAHIHYGDDHPNLLALLEKRRIKLLNISFAAQPGRSWRKSADRYRDLAQQHPERFAWCTSFDLPEPDEDGYIDRIVGELERDFAQGAVGCKIWKNIGMEVRKEDGSYLLVDDPILDPVFESVTAAGRTLLAHIAEPLACWQPLDESNPHYGYYSRNPQWHMVGRSDMPSHGALMAARDRVLERHPRMRFVGAHLASLEWDVDVLAERFDRYPNLVVDISARVVDLICQDSSKVRRFFIEYQDRILFGTDVVLRGSLSEMAEEARDEALAGLDARFETYLAYLESGTLVRERGRESEGLNLPAAVLDKILRTNAERWYPGIS